MTLTPAQRRILETSRTSRPIEGLIQFHGHGTGVGLRRASWEKAVAKLVIAGLAAAYSHGEYEITDAGRAERDKP